MRRLAACLAILAVLCACGPRGAEPEPFPAASPPVAIVTAAAPATPPPQASPPAPPPSPGVAGAPPTVHSPLPGVSPVPPDVKKSAEEALRTLWQDPRRFYDAMLLEARRKESSYAEFAPAIVENVVRPSGALKGMRPIPNTMFELSEGYLATGIYAAPEVAAAEAGQYGDAMHRTYWALEVEQGDILAGVVLVPRGSGWAVQTLALNSRSLGTPLDREDAESRKAVLAFLDLVRQGRGEALYREKTSKGMQEVVPLPRFEQSVAELRADLPAEGTPDPRMERGQRWYSNEGWTRTWEYRLPGRKGPILLNINLLEEGRLVTGVTWSAAPEGSPAAPAP